MLAQIGAFALPALPPDYAARWKLSKTEAKRCATVAASSASTIQHCQMLRGRKMVAPAPIRQASPQVPKLSIHAMTCEVPPNWSSVTPNSSVPRKLAPKPMQE
jgi:hypothetical protein